MNMKKAALINAVGKYSQVIIQLIISAVLSRILSSDDYGVVAIVTVFSTFFATLSNMGFGTAIIQRKDLTEKDVNNIFTFTFYISIGLAAVFALMSFPIAWFYKDNVYIPITLMLSISLFFNAMNMVPNGMMNRDKQFVKIAARTIVVYSAAGIIAIILALLHFRFYALIIQTILASAITFFWNYFSTKPRLLKKVDMTSIRKVANYSGFQFAFNFINYFAGNLDNLLTGKFFGKSELGYYNKAYTLSLYPVNNLNGVISPVLHPILSDFQNDKETLYRKYMKVLKLLVLIGIYVEAVCYYAGREIITIMYGGKWENSIICFQMLSLCIVFRMVNSSSSAIFQSLGNTKLLFINGTINTCISVIAILIGIFAFGDIQHLSICVACAYICHYLTASYMLISMGFGFRQRDYYKELAPDLLILAVTMAACFLIRINISSVIVSAVVKVAVVSAVFLAMIILTKEYKVLLMLLPKRFRAKSS